MRHFILTPYKSSICLLNIFKTKDPSRGLRHLDSPNSFSFTIINFQNKRPVKGIETSNVSDSVIVQVPLFIFKTKDPSRGLRPFIGRETVVKPIIMHFQNKRPVKGIETELSKYLYLLRYLPIFKTKDPSRGLRRISSSSISTWGTSYFQNKRPVKGIETKKLKQQQLQERMPNFQNKRPVKGIGT